MAEQRTPFFADPSSPPLQQQPDVELTRVTASYKKPNFSSIDTAYSRLSDSDSDETIAKQKGALADEGLEEPEQLSIWWIIFTQFFAFLWIVPIAALLYLNISNRILGASAWCPFGNCLPQLFNGDQSNALALAAKYDKETHNLNGALQLVAKALEVWFILIASWLVYLLAVAIAQRSAGLPIGYYTRPVEFADPAGLFDSSLWTTLLGSKFQGESRAKSRKRILFFIVLTLLLCIVVSHEQSKDWIDHADRRKCNLIGPATAVLVLPSLQWIETPKVETRRFDTLNTWYAPWSSGWTKSDVKGYCSDEQFNMQNFSCATNWADKLDGWVDSYIAARLSSYSMSVQGALTFAPNQTHVTNNAGKYESITWIASRQVLADLNDDYAVVQSMSQGSPPKDDSYVPYNNTVSSALQRDGPITGALIGSWSDYNNEQHWWTQVDDSRSVRCYEGYNLSNTPEIWGSMGPEYASGIYTRCIPTGYGWYDSNNWTYYYSNFSIDRQWNAVSNTFGPELNVDLLYSQITAFLPNGTLPENFPEDCLKRNDWVPDGTNCDWTAFFINGSSDNATSYRSNGQTTIEISANPEVRDGYPSNLTLAIDFVAWQAFASYSFDPSWMTNPLSSSDNSITVPPAKLNINWFNTTYLNPVWIQAAFAVDSYGKIDASRSISTRIMNVMNSMYSSYNTSEELRAHPLFYDNSHVDAISLIPILQGLSLIEFNTTDPKNDNFDDGIWHPLFHRNARINVWAYGLASRTSYLGALIAITGILVVLAEVAIGLADRRKFRSPTELLIAAMEHRNRDEFKDVKEMTNVRNRDRHVARVCYRLENDHTRVGKFKFEKVG